MPPDHAASSPPPAGVDASPLARILAHETAYWTCVAEVEPRAGWKLFHNHNLVPRIDPNHAGEFRASAADAAAIVHDIIAFYTSRGATPAAYVDCLAAPAELADQLRAAGFVEWSGATNDLMLYIGPDRAPPSTAHVEVVASADERRAWASVVEDDADAATRRVLERLYLSEVADARITAYLVRHNGRAVCRGELFSSDGLGRVEAVRTLTHARGRGLATAVVRRAIADSLAQGNALTYIYAEAGGDAQRLYGRLGFRTVVADAIRAFTR
jgi:GNAT superfamily N-acetyltransferase